MLVSLHITHSSAGGMECLTEIIPGLEEAVTSALKDAPEVKEYVVIRTCNRLEAYAATDDNHAVRLLMEDTVRKAIPYAQREYWYILQDDECIKHLFTVVCGIDSLIVGEDQIQHQVRDSFAKAQKEGHVGRVLYSLFNNAIVVGKKVRTETELNKGAVSVGYAAIELAEKEIGSLEDKEIAIIGAGDMAGLIAKNLAGKGPKTVFVSNRTFERAQELAKELGGTAVRMDRLLEMITRSDLVLVATSAHHDVVSRQMVEAAMARRPDRPLLIIDVSVPTNVAKDAGEVPNVTLSTMADLDSIAAENVARRKHEIQAAEKIIKEEMAKIGEERKTQAADEVIRGIGIMSENVRKMEAEKAVQALEHGADPQETIDAMSRAIIKQLSADIIKNLRQAALRGEDEVVEAASRLFAQTEGKE